MKKLLVVLMILFVGILLCGCTSQPATPPATVAPTAVPTTVVTTVAPTVVATTATPAPVNKTATPTPTPTPIPDQKIKITNTLTFSPAVINIPAGTKVIWWTDAIGYKFKVGIQGVGFNVNSDIISPQTTWSYTFTKPGTYTMSEMLSPQFRNDQTKIVVT